MLDRMKEFLRCAAKVKGSETFLLGVSGGMDSVVMASLFQEAGIKFAMAHCHFGLRGKEADDDALFVKVLATRHGCPFFYKSFQTLAYAREKRLSVQEAARELRFGWFQELIEAHGFDLIALAHHKDDERETFFINLLRGTGIHGLNGLHPRLGKLVHPLLFATRNEINEYASIHGIMYREDSSNSSDKYLRNRIRHELMPLISSFRMGAEQRLSSNIQRLREESGLLDQYLDGLAKAYVKMDIGGYTSIGLPEELQEPGLVAFTHYMLAPFGFSFTQSGQVSRAWRGEPGRQFSSISHECLVDRGRLIIREKICADILEYEIDVSQDVLCLPFRASLTHLPIAELNTLDQGSHVALLDLDGLKFPLRIRRWKPGDVFQPLGMQGKRKLSDFFVDEKLSLFEKECIWVVESGGKIAWIVGHRIDHRFRVTRKTKWIYRMEILPASQ